MIKIAQCFRYSKSIQRMSIPQLASNEIFFMISRVVFLIATENKPDSEIFWFQRNFGDKPYLHEGGVGN
jgi:hypothetical protein